MKMTTPVKILKLTNGETIIAEIVKYNEYYIELLNQMLVILQQKGDNLNSFIKPWVYGSNDAVYTIYHNNIITSYNVKPAIYESYMKMFEDVTSDEEQKKRDDEYMKDALDQFKGNANTSFH